MPRSSRTRIVRPSSGPGRLLDTARLVLLGPAPLSRLTATHCIHSAAEAFVTVSLAGSVFFSVSAEAARPRVLLFLILSLAPFLVLAPLIGPVVDRLRGGLRMTIVSSFAIRCVLAVALAEHLRTLLLFPLVFGILVVANTYTVARNALVPNLVEHPERDLVAANARLSRTATIAGAIAAAAAVGLYAASSGAWTLRVAALIYLIALVNAWRIPPTDPGPPTATVDQDRDENSTIHYAVLDMLALRAAGGFAMFAFAFALRADAEARWMFGLLIVANSGGAFLGTVITPWMRRRLDEQSMFTAALAAVTITTTICGLVFNPATLTSTMFSIGLSTSIGRRALDATIQFHGTRSRRGRLYARLETRLEMAWAAAGALAVSLGIAPWVAILALAGFLATATGAHVRRNRLSILHPPVPLPLGERLLLRARALADDHHYDEAALVAISAHDPTRGPTPLSTREQRDVLTGARALDRAEAMRIIEAVQAANNPPDPAR